MNDKFDLLIMTHQSRSAIVTRQGIEVAAARITKREKLKGKKEKRKEKSKMKETRKRSKKKRKRKGRRRRKKTPTKQLKV